MLKGRHLIDGHGEVAEARAAQARQLFADRHQEAAEHRWSRVRVGLTRSAQRSVGSATVKDQVTFRHKSTQGTVTPSGFQSRPFGGFLRSCQGGTGATALLCQLTLPA